MAILDRYKDERDLFGTVICQNLDLTVPGRLLHLPLFKAFDRKFRMLLTMYCERHAFFPEHQVLREGDTGDRCWILNTGPCTLQKKGFTVKIFSPGMVFGCDHMLGLSRVYCGTLTAMTVCHMLAVSRQSYLLALNQYPAKGAAQTLLRVQKVECAALREAVERTAVKKGIWQRYQGEVSGTDLSDNERLKRIVGAWHMATSLLREKRMSKIHHEQDMCNMLEDWKVKTAENRRRVEPKKRLDALIKANIYERGPLRTMDEADFAEITSAASQEVKTERRPKTTEKERRPKTMEKERRPKTTEKLREEPSPETKQLVTFLQNWPQPRSSPHYNLRVYNVVREEIVTRGSVGNSCLLPLLSNNASSDSKGKHVMVSELPGTKTEEVESATNDGGDSDEEDPEVDDILPPPSSRTGARGSLFRGTRASVRQPTFGEEKDHMSGRKMTAKENLARKKSIMEAISQMSLTGGIMGSEVATMVSMSGDTATTREQS